MAGASFGREPLGLSHPHASRPARSEPIATSAAGTTTRENACETTEAQGTTERGQDVNC